MERSSSRPVEPSPGTARSLRAGWAPNALAVAILAVSVVAVPAASAAAENWPQWRGPGGDGVSRESGVPIAWSENLGIRWKCPLPEWGNSTPIIWDDAVFVTTQENDDRLLLLRIDRATGRIEWTREVGRGSTPSAAILSKGGAERRHQKFHATHNLASPSPATDGEVVVVHFGNGDLAAYDFSGQQLWHRNLQQDHGDYTIWWGHANSPVLCGDLVISVALQDSCADLPGDPSPSYLVAHDKRTGQRRWFTPRPPDAVGEPCDSYVTPILWRRRGRLELVLMGGRVLDAHDPATGERLWWLPGLAGNRVIPSPVVSGETIFAIQGMREPLLAVRPGGDGQRSRDDILWRSEPGTSDSPSPIVWGELLFMVTNDGILRAFDTLSGRLRWKERIRGSYRASPVAAEGRVYWLNTDGLTTVVAVSDRFTRLTENRLDDATFASPAISGGCVYLRSRKWLYCIGK